MRPAIVESLNAWIGINVFGYLVPTEAVVYGFTAFLVIWVFWRRSRKVGLSEFHVLGATIWALLGGLIGARVLYLALRPRIVIENLELIWNMNGGTISWGAYFGGVIAFAWYLRRHAQPIGLYADVSASVAGLAPFLGRFACYLNGDDYGRIATVPWAVTYPPDTYPFLAHARSGLIEPLAAASLPVHPVQLYESLAGLVIFCVVSHVWRAGLRPAGAVFFLYWMLYGAARFAIEFWRGHGPRVHLGPFPDGQFIALVVALGSGLVLLALMNRKTRLRRWAFASEVVR